MHNTRVLFFNEVIYTYLLFLSFSIGTYKVVVQQGYGEVTGTW